MEEQEFSSILSPNICDPTTSFSCLVSSGRHEKQITYLADTLPVTARCNRNIEIWNRNDSILSRYWSPEDGIATKIFEDGSDSSSHLDSQSHQLTYGEVTPLGVRQLAYEMGIVDCDDQDDGTTHIQNDKKDQSEIVFYDLGSGVGRLVTQMYIDQPDRIAKAIGIELAEDRHTIGAFALERIIAEEQYRAEQIRSPYDEGNDVGDRSTLVSTNPCPIQLIHGDALELDFDEKTSHVFMSSLCFPEDVLLALQKKLLRLPNISVIAALNRLDLIYHLDGEQWEERSVMIQMSWGDCMAKIYHKIV